MGRQRKKKVQPVVAKTTEGVENVKEAKPEVVKVNVQKPEKEEADKGTLKAQENNTTNKEEEKEATTQA